jgi:hypothetical protein
VTGGTDPDALAAGPAVRRSGQPSGVFQWLVLAAVCVSLAAYSFLRSPIPAVNEPHYLTKARHYWQPEWCPGDLFLESSNPHRVFYQTIGLLADRLTLPQAAVAGRLISLGLLAWGWWRLTALVLPRPWSPLLALWVFLLLHSLGNLSGEWLVGGVEGKVPAYAFAFAGWAGLMEGRWLTTGLCLGLSVSFHPIVGVWSVVVAAMSSTWLGLRRAGWSMSPLQAIVGRRCLAGMALGGLCALPGLLPAIEMLRGVDPAVAARADRLQVGVRLAHHLDPMQFPLASYRYYGLLLVLWGLMRRGRPPSRSAAEQCLTSLAVSAVLVAVAGWLVGWGPRPLDEMPYAALRTSLLKFYPFRLTDILVPLLVAVTVIQGGMPDDDSPRPAAGSWGCWAACGCALVLSLVLPHEDRHPSRLPADQHADWLDVLVWVRDHTPRDALLYSANEDWAVKWYAERAEYANYKDCPQDAPSLVAWADRINTIRRWVLQAFADGRCTRAELGQLHTQTGVTHLVCTRLGPFEASPVHRNRTFRVYELGPSPERQAPAD